MIVRFQKVSSWSTPLPCPVLGSPAVGQPSSGNVLGQILPESARGRDLSQRLLSWPGPATHSPCVTATGNRISYRQYVEEFSDTRMPIVFPRPEAAPNLEPHDNIYPTQNGPVLLPVEGGLALRELRWGLIPWFHKKPVKEWKALTTNARSETIATTPSFKSAFARRRCLIPVSSFYEWTGEKGRKTKWDIHIAGREWFCFAGIWDKAETADGVIESYALVTMAPKAAIRAAPQSPAADPRTGRNMRHELDERRNSRGVIPHRAKPATLLIEQGNCLMVTVRSSISRWLRHWDRWMGQALAGGGKEVPGIGGDIECALAAGIDDAEAGGIETAAFVGPGSEADAPGDHGVAQGTLGLVVGRRQRWIVDERDDRIPVVEDLRARGHAPCPRPRIDGTGQFHFKRVTNRLTDASASPAATFSMNWRRRSRARSRPKAAPAWS